MCTATLPVRDLQLTTMQPGNAPGNAQTETGMTARPVAGSSSPERLEDRLQVWLGDTGTAVTDADFQGSICLDYGHLDHLPVGGMLKCILQQVVEHPLDQGDVNLGCRQIVGGWPHLQPDSGPDRPRLEFQHHVLE